jgi:hypothetical protein
MYGLDTVSEILLMNRANDNTPWQNTDNRGIYALFIMCAIFALASWTVTLFKSIRDRKFSRYSEYENSSFMYCGFIDMVTVIYLGMAIITYIVTNILTFI